jgi:hypothetical protein
MRQPRTLLTLATAKYAVAAIALAAATGVAFASWVEHGPGIFMAMIDSGLSWCF